MHLLCLFLAAKSAGGAALRWTRIILTFTIENIVFLGLMYGTVKFFNLKLRPDWTIDSRIGKPKVCLVIFLNYNVIYDLYYL